LEAVSNNYQQRLLLGIVSKRKDFQPQKTMRCDITATEAAAANLLRFNGWDFFIQFFLSG
jgi:hypothetical protein